MGSGARSSFLLVAPVLCAAMLLGLFVDHCACQTPQIYTLGGAAGWTDVANKKYTAEMAAVPFKAGDTIREFPSHLVICPFVAHVPLELRITKRTFLWFHFVFSSLLMSYVLLCAVFNNNDTKVHDVLQVYTQEDYDTCNTNGQMGWTLNPGDTHGVSIESYQDPFTQLLFC